MMMMMMVTVVVLMMMTMLFIQCRGIVVVTMMIFKFVVHFVIHS